VPTDIKSLTRDELEAQFKSWNEPVYRVTQLLEWLYARRAASWDAMTNLPKPLRGKLRDKFSLHCLEHHAKVPLETRRRLAHRKRFDSGQPGALRRGERPAYALHFHSGRLRLWLQILRQRPRRLETQSHAG
jgi:hypothetical protein